MTGAERAALGGAVAVVAALGLLLPFTAVVRDREMAPSVLPGDFVVLVPRAPEVGDVVAVIDPLDPARWTLRRVESLAGPVRYEDGMVVPATGDPPVLEMGRTPEEVVLREGDHLVRHRGRPVRWEQGEVLVPEGWMWLGADNREDALDSRWWGPLPTSAAQGVVVLRVGSPQHPWRSWISRRP